MTKLQAPREDHANTSAGSGEGRRYAIGIGALAVVATAVVVIALRSRPTGRAHGEVALVLGPTRVLEARFEAGPFARYRPPPTVRGERAREAIPLSVLAALQQHGETETLVAALAASGDLARARALAAAHAAAVPASDRAALALAAGDPEQALELLDGDATSPASTWNAALAAAALGLPAVAHARFTAIANRGERGWAAEAARRAGALARQLAEHDRFRAFRRRGYAMIEGAGPVITAADVAAFPAFSRIYFLDALRVAKDRAAALALSPLADALDRATATTHARAALERVAAARFAVRARFREAYLALIQGKLDRTRMPGLLDDLARAGHDVDDIFVGALFWTGEMRARLDEMRARLGPDQDPWFELVITHVELQQARQQLGAAAVLGRLRAAADTCDDAWAYRCARLALDAAGTCTAAGLDDEALRYVKRARAQYAAAGAPTREDRALVYLGDLMRYRDRRALARAYFEEVERRTESDDCALKTSVRVDRANLALVERRFAEARGLLPPPDACGNAPDRIAMTVAVDIARQSRTAADRAVAERWLEAARRAGDPDLARLAEIAADRLAIDRDPSVAPALQARAAELPADVSGLAWRAWAVGAVIDAAGERGDWAAVAEAARAEIGLPPSSACLVVASVDDDRQIVAVRDAAGRWAGVARRAPIRQLVSRTFIPHELAARLAGCPRIDVLARPPLHGRTDLLPPELPWAFVRGPRHAPARGAPRTVIVTGTEPPVAALRLPHLPAEATPGDGVTVIEGVAATPSRVLAALAHASYVQIDAHGIADLEAADASFLALSPEASGKFTLTAADIRKAKLDGPVVVLAACRGARLAPYLNRRWSLPDAFLIAGARAVIATDVDIPDPSAGAVFAQIRARITGGEPPARAVAEVRAAAIAADPASWVARIAVFE